MLCTRPIHIKLFSLTTDCSSSESNARQSVCSAGACEVGERLVAREFAEVHSHPLNSGWVNPSKDSLRTQALFACNGANYLVVIFF